MRHCLVLLLLICPMNANAFEIFGIKFGGGNPPARDYSDYHGPRDRNRGPYGPIIHDRDSRPRYEPEWPEFDYEANERENTRHRYERDRHTNDDLGRAIEESDGDEEIKAMSKEALQHSYRYLEIHNDIKAEIARMVSHELLNIATSLTPGVSWGRDVYEFISGKDLHSGERINGFERTMAGLNAVALGFANRFRFASEVIGKLAKNSYAAQALIAMVKDRHSIGEVIEILKYFKEVDIGAARFRDYLIAFLPGARVRILEEDLKVYRYYSEKGGSPRGYWVAPRKVRNPQEDLAIFSSPPYLVEEWIIPRGTKILEGYAASLKGLPGGAAQIFVDMRLLQ